MVSETNKEIMSTKTIVKIGDEFTVQFSYSDGYTSSTLINKSWKTRKGAEKWLENFNKIKG